MPSRKGFSSFLKKARSKDSRQGSPTKSQLGASPTNTANVPSTPYFAATEQTSNPSQQPQQQQQQATIMSDPEQGNRTADANKRPDPPRASTGRAKVKATNSGNTNASADPLTSGYAGGESTSRRKTSSAQVGSSDQYKAGGAYMPPQPVQSTDTIDEIMTEKPPQQTESEDKYRMPTYLETMSDSVLSGKNNDAQTAASRTSYAEQSRSGRKTIQPPSMRNKRTIDAHSVCDESTQGGGGDDETYASFEQSAMSVAETSYSRYTGEGEGRLVPPTRTRRGRRDREHERDVMSVGATTYDSEQSRSYAPSVSIWSAADSMYYDPKKQRVAWWCIAFTAIQFMILLTQLLMCGVATLDKNMLVGPFPDVFSEWGGKNPYLLLVDSQHYRLVTSLFLNVGVIHLIINAYCTLETAYRYEREWGTPSFLIVFFVSGIAGVATSCVFDPDTIAVCSSGPLLGVFGAKFAQVLSWTCFDMDERATNLEDVGLEQLGNLTCSIAMLLVMSFLTFVDFSGNMGSMCVGFLVGMFLFCRPIENLCVRFMWGIMLGLFLLLGYGYAITYLLLNYTETDEDMEDSCKYFSNIFPEGYDCDCVWN